MSKFRITYYAEGHRNGCKVTLHDMCAVWFTTTSSLMQTVGIYATTHLTKKLSYWQRHASDTQK